MHRSILFVLTLAAIGFATTAGAAEPVVYGPDGAPTVVQRKLYTMTGRWELAFGLSTAINGALVDHYGGHLGLTYHPNEWFDWGAEVVGHYAALSGLSDQVRDKLPARSDANTKQPNTGDELANVAQLRVGGLLVARLAPFYGKFNLASEIKVHFQAYGLLGAGAALFHHESVNICATPGAATCFTKQSNGDTVAGPYLTSDAVRPTGTLGVGLRFYLGDRFSLGAELRGYLFPDTYREGVKLTDPASGTDKTYLGVLTTFGVNFATLF